MEKRDAARESIPVGDPGTTIVILGMNLRDLTTVNETAEIEREKSLRSEFLRQFLRGVQHKS